MPAIQTKSVSPFQSRRRLPALEVLILDDDRYDRHRLARLCSRLEFRCDVHNAKTLKEFEKQLDHENFGLILLDYALPDGTGLDALHLVQQSARNLNTPTLMISGQTRDDVPALAHAAGCAGYLCKDSLSSDGFLRAVKGALASATPIVSPQSDQFDAGEVQQILARANANCAQEIKPLVSRLMRQLRNLRSGQTIEDGTGMQALEKNCLGLWTVLVEMQRTDGAALMAQIVPSSFPKGMAMQDKKPFRPPSPFTSRRH